jgi:hypothetical protein
MRNPFAAAAVLPLICLSACPGPSNGDVQMDPPALGFQLATEAFTVPAATEVQRCYFFAVPANVDAGAADVWVGHIIAAQNPGSHHLNVFRVKTVLNLDGAPGAIVDGGQCWISSNWADWPLVMNSQQSVEGENIVDWTLPGGVAQRFTPGEKLMLQIHYVNASTQQTPGRGKGIVNFIAEPQTSSLAELGTVFATDQNVKICPGDTNVAFSTTCRFASTPVTIIAANGHFHSRGIEFDMSTVDARNNPVTPFYKSTQWEDPVFTRGIAVQVPAGGGIGYTCHYTLDANACCDSTKGCCCTFGGHVETQEHCNAFVYYYPKITDQTCF